MLSSPPRSLASSTSAVAARATSPAASPRMRAMSSSPIMVVRPSEQRRRTSPARHPARLDVDEEVRAAAEGAGHDVAEGVAAGLLGGDDAALDLLVDPRVVVVSCEISPPLQR